MKLKHPLDIGTFLHSAKQPDWNHIYLICGRRKTKTGWRYTCARFYYFPHLVSSRLDRFGIAYFKRLSSTLDKEGWQIVNVEKGEVAK
jgi:hypothetical protein